MFTSTLVLDIGYQPHRVISWQRAVTMVFQGICEVVESYDETLMTGRQAERARANGLPIIPMIPAVVHLLREVARHTKAVKFSRVNVLARDNWCCGYCGKKFRTADLNYDHVLPRSRGGRTVWENIVTCCYPCNERKGGRTPEEAGMKLRTRPIKPQRLPIISFYMDSKTIPDVWKSWLGESNE